MGCSTTSASTASLLDRVLNLKINKAVIDYLASYVCCVVRLSSEAASYPEDTSLSSKNSKPHVDAIPSDPQPQSNRAELPALGGFIQNVAMRSRCTMSTVVVTLIYLNRLCAAISSKSPANKACSRHRVVFSALMIAHKVSNDSSMVGKHWAEVSNMFTSDEVLAMEREMLQLLKYDLEVTMREIWDVAYAFMTAPFLSLTAAEQATLAYYAPMVPEEQSFSFSESPITYQFVDYSPQIVNVAPPLFSSEVPGLDHQPVYDIIHPYSSLSVPSSQYDTSASISPRSLHVSPVVSPFLDPLPAQVPSPKFLSQVSPRLLSLPSTSSRRSTRATARSSRSVPHLSGARTSCRTTKSSSALATRMTMASISNQPLKVESSRLKKRKHPSSHRISNAVNHHPYSSRRPPSESSPHQSSSSGSSTSIPSTPHSFGQVKTKSSITLSASAKVKSPMVWYLGPEFRLTTPTFGCK